MKNKPCKDCPFRKDKEGYGLHPKRAREILESIERDSEFTCHETVGKKEAPCIGSAIYLENTRPGGMLSNLMYRLAVQSKIIPKPEELNRSIEVYKNKKEAIKGMTTYFTQAKDSLG
ncbi:DUF6283 family protein [Synechococcus sp. PCC 6312]|uniref:DUF6283 family protein n=1 Tax=Synechococcus sp. (strain ATCC 27167 / PCC 6312) TaxID=195253 RepID=UPI00059E0464|nr:DUF6283 family protein [Synechococcus sp. PCC 6312]